jgi:hypothetical protein
MAPGTRISAAPVSAPPGPATRVRYGVLAFLCALAFVLYVDRITWGRCSGG